MRFSISLVFPALLLCGNAPAQAGNDARDVAFREHVAGIFAADCQRTRAPNAAQLRVLRRLCSCSAAHIRSSDIAFADGQDLVTRKVHAAADACSREVYGPDGEATQNSN